MEENRFNYAQKMTNHTALNFKLGDRVFFENKQPCKWDMNWKAGYRIVRIEHNGHYLYLENQATGKTRPCNIKDVIHKLLVELWNADKTFGRAGKLINHPAGLPTITLNTK